MADEDQLDGLVVAAAAHDETAWKSLWAAIEVPLSRIVAQPRLLGRLAHREDDQRNIVVAVMARLRADGFRRLRLYLDAKRENPALLFLSWLRVVAKRVAIDYLRAHPEYVRGVSSHARWIDVRTLPPASKIHGGRPPVTNRETARELLEFAAGAIPDEQRLALELWSQGERFDDIARALDLTDAERTVRAAIERLRRRFRGKEPS